MLLQRLLAVIAATSLVGTVFASPVEHTYDLKNVLWKLSFSMTKGSISGEVTNTVVLRDMSDTLQFHCEDLAVSKVAVNGQRSAFSTADGKLTVTLPSVGEPGATYKVRILYSGRPQRGLYFVPGANAFPSKYDVIYSQGEGEDNHFWIPTYDKPDDKATSECYVTVPKGWTAVSNGSLLGVAHHGSSDVWHWKMSIPFSTYLISLVAGPFVQVKDHWRSTPVDFYVPPGLVAEGRAAFSETPRMIELYSKLTGFDYPWPKFAQEAVGDFMFGGMENVSAVTQTIRTLHEKSAEPVKDSTYLVAHELAHQWFGDTITCRTWEHLWLNEGFATTLPMFYARSTRGEEEFELNRFHNFEGAIDTMGMRNRKAVGGGIGSSANPTMGSVYDGGSSRIMVLYHHLGEQRFWSGIKAFLHAYKFQPVTTDDFFNVVGKTVGEDLTEFKKLWFYSPATPSLFASVDGSNLVVDQLAPFYTFDVPVWILDGDVWVKKVLHLAGEHAKLPLGNLAGKPFIVDPEVWVPMELTYRQPYAGEQVVALYRHSPSVAQRARLIAHQFDGIPVSDRIRAIRDEHVVGLIQMVTDHIGPEGEGYLLELTGSKDKRVVNSALVALSRFQLSRTALARCAKIGANDTNEPVREAAMQAVLNSSRDADLAHRLWRAKAFDDGFRVMALGWMAKNEPDKAREVALAFMSKSDSEPVRVAAINALAIVKDKAGEHRVFSALASVARERVYWARIAAVNALGQLGNKDALPILQPLTVHGPGGVSGTAQAAVNLLSKN